MSRLVGYVNGRYGSVCHQPVAFVHRTLTLGELSGLYAVADVAIVGSIREGVNLAAMEFVAAQSFSSRDQKGVLLYSEFAGCASSFQVCCSYTTALYCSVALVCQLLIALFTGPFCHFCIIPLHL